MNYTLIFLNSLILFTNSMIRKKIRVDVSGGKSQIMIYFFFSPQTLSPNFSFKHNCQGKSLRFRPQTMLSLSKNQDKTLQNKSNCNIFKQRCTCGLHLTQFGPNLKITFLTFASFDSLVPQTFSTKVIFNVDWS